MEEQGKQMEVIGVHKLCSDWGPVDDRFPLTCLLKFSKAHGMNKLFEDIITGAVVGVAIECLSAALCLQRLTDTFRAYE